MTTPSLNAPSGAGRFLPIKQMTAGIKGDMS